MKNQVNTAYFSIAYLAPVQYYSKLLRYRQIYVEAHENYVKQTYRTRCDIAAANGVLTLSIPVDKGTLQKCPIKDLRISDAEDWQRQHWKSIESAYRTSPFFDYYEDDFRPFYEKKYRFLFDFNSQLQEKVIALLGLDDVKIKETAEYKVDFTAKEIDFRDTIHPKKQWKTTDANFSAIPYYQVFGQKHGFLPNLSIVDLLFNMGNEARLVLNKASIMR